MKKCFAFMLVLSVFLFTGTALAATQIKLGVVTKPGSVTPSANASCLS